MLLVLRVCSNEFRHPRNIEVSIPLLDSLGARQHGFHGNKFTKTSGYIEDASIMTVEYSSLAGDEKTRLLYLEPGSFADPLRCRLKHVRALKDHQYEALSYVWGPDSSDYFILRTTQKITITSNLDAALRQLRYSDRGRLLWVDAICVNQADKTERSKQVSIMREIYSNAARVIIWLGEESESDCLAFQSLNAIRCAIRQRNLRSPTEAAVELGWYRDKNGKVMSGGAHWSVLSDIEYEHLVRLLCRDWFRRTWVIQEAASASLATVMCGAKYMAWELFAQTYIDLGDKFLPINQFGGPQAHLALGIISAIEQARRSRSGPLTMSLFHILLATCSSECKDQRDKIYAIIGLAKDWTETSMLAPDYEVSETKVLQLFKQFAVLDTNHHRTLRILSCASGPSPRRKIHPLPSWVPDWRKLDNPHLFVRYSERTQFCASRRMTPVAWYSGKHHLLNVTGKIVDSVSKIGPESAFSKAIAIFEVDDKKIEELRASSSWLEQCRQLAFGEYQDTLTKIHKNFWKTMMCGLTGEAFPVPESYSTYFDNYMKFIAQAPQKFHQYMSESEALPQGVTGMHEVAPNFEKHALVEASLDRWSSKRRFCVTYNERLAFVPPAAKKGDIITILFGGEVPYVLRPLNNGWYNVVGECYVNGMMYGEGLSDDASERVFTLW
jgi:hypothetical protein